MLAHKTALKTHKYERFNILLKSEYFFFGFVLFCVLFRFWFFFCCACVEQQCKLLFIKFKCNIITKRNKWKRRLLFCFWMGLFLYVAVCVCVLCVRSFSVCFENLKYRKPHTQFQTTWIYKHVWIEREMVCMGWEMKTIYAQQNSSLMCGTSTHIRVYQRPHSFICDVNIRCIIHKYTINTFNYLDAQQYTHTNARAHTHAHTQAKHTYAIHREESVLLLCSV